MTMQVVRDLGGGHKECDTKRYVRIEKVSEGCPHLACWGRGV